MHPRLVTSWRKYELKIIALYGRVRVPKPINHRCTEVNYTFSTYKILSNLAKEVNTLRPLVQSFDVFDLNSKTWSIVIAKVFSNAFELVYYWNLAFTKQIPRPYARQLQELRRVDSATTYNYLAISSNF
jgi:inactivated superfamily I helicase